MPTPADTERRPWRPVTLYARPGDPWSRRLCAALRAKYLSEEVHVVWTEFTPSWAAEYNPMGALPMLADKAVVLYAGAVIEQYVDTRYPVPPLQPIDATARAVLGVALYRIEHEWWPLLDRGPKSIAAELERAAPLFASRPYFLSDSYSLADAALEPLFAAVAERKGWSRPIERYLRRIEQHEAECVRRHSAGE